MTAREVLAKMRTITDTVVVAFSCGKDSAAVLDVCAGTFLRIECYFQYVVPGLEFQERYLRYTEGRYGVKIHRLPHWNLSNLLRRATFRPHTNATLSCPALGIAAIEAEVRRRTGIEWIASGEKINDSLERRGMIKSCAGVDPKRRRFYPILDWSDRQVKRYLQVRKIPLAPEYQYLKRSFMPMNERDLAVVREHFPADYKRILEMFPYAEASHYRRERAHQRAAGVPADADSAQPDQAVALEPA